MPCGGFDYFSVIECQAREAAYWAPLELARVVGGSGPDFFCQHGGKGYAYGVAPRVAARIAEGPNLLELDPPDASFLPKLARSGRLERFILVNESARQRPHPFKRSSRAPYQEHLYPANNPAKQHNIDRHGRARVIVTVAATLFHTLSSRSKAS
jgi:hypothetical protein